MLARRAGRRHYYGLQDVRTCRYSVTPAQLITHRCDCACEVTRQDDTKPLSACKMAAQRDGAHSTPLRATFATLSHYYPRCCIRFKLLWGHLSDSGTQCDYPVLSYKRTGQTSSLMRLFGTSSFWASSTHPWTTLLSDNTQQYTHIFLCGCRLLRSDGLNHVNPQVQCVSSIGWIRETFQRQIIMGCSRIVLIEIS
jgi:hypothetical protein